METVGSGGLAVAAQAPALGAGVVPYQRGLALAGGVVGALMGALLWGLLGKATSFELKAAAVLLGAASGLGVLLMGRARGNGPSIMAGGCAAIGLLLGKLLFSLWVLGPMGHDAGAMVRYHTTALDFVFLFVAVAVAAFIPAGDHVRGLIRKVTGRARV